MPVRFQQAHHLLGNLSPREKKLVIVGDRDEGAVEHPAAVVYDLGPVNELVSS
jgi:hypothetical protein